jgi:DNA-binding CsgD family transcriptional regulator
VFYTAWNLFSLYYGFKEFGAMLYGDGKSRPKISETIVKNNSMDNFCNKYGITAREREVVNLLINGYSYNKICENLVISLPTTKSHVYNIYQKTGVKGKIELLNLVKDSEFKLQSQNTVT